MKIFIDNTYIYYEKKGSGDPLIMLHGNGESCRIFDKSVELLKHYFTVYTLDTRGHGKSSAVKKYHYSDMAEDVSQFIRLLNIKSPILYGFSDGGIVALMVAIRYKHLISRLIISGANTSPSGIKLIPHIAMAISYIFTHSPLKLLMLKEPNITEQELHSINLPVLITAGSKDIIKFSNTKFINTSINNSCMHIFNGETHGSYIVNSTKIAKYIIEST